MRGSHGGRQAEGSGKRRRHEHDAFDRRFHGRRREARRTSRQATGGDQPVQHVLRHQAPHRPPLRRPDGREGQEPRPLQDRQRSQRRRLGRSPRQAVFAAADLGLHPAEDEGNRRSQARREGHAGGHHRSRLLQRRPAPGHQGRRQDRRPRGAAHHQRADGSSARLRPRQEERFADHRRLRPRRRHVRHLDPRDRRRRVRGEVDERRHVPRRRRLRHEARLLPRRGVQEGAGHRPAQRQARPAAAEGSRREGEDRAVERHADRDQPAVHHRRCIGSEASDDEAHPRQAGEPRRRPHRAHQGSVREGHQGRRPQGSRHRRGRSRRRHDAHAEGAGGRQAAVRQGAAQGRQPG